MKKIKIGLLGGSFNPPHQGHIHISLLTKKILKLKQIWWIPTKKNPFKETSKISFQDKINNCQNLTKKYQQIKIKDLENNQKNGKGFYTINVLKNINRKYKKYQFFWIMGADNILEFHYWRNWQTIIKLVPLVICDRNNYFLKATRSKGFLFAKKLNKVHFLKIKKLNQSSTSIRHQENKILHKYIYEI